MLFLRVRRMVRTPVGYSKGIGEKVRTGVRLRRTPVLTFSLEGFALKNY